MNKFLRRGLLLVVCLVVLQLVLGATAVLAEGWHVVRCGETLFAIGRMYGVNPYQIAQVNGLANPDYIRIGQWLYIPRGGWSQPPARQPSYGRPRQWGYPGYRWNW